MNMIGNIDIKQLAVEYGTPLYVYDKNRIIENYQNLNGAFRKYYPNTRIHYSVKANNNISILRTLRDVGSGVDCSSPVELKLATIAGFNPPDILYTGNYESIEDLTTALDLDVTINLDDINSFKRMMKIRIPDRIAFRINPGIGRGGFEGIITGGTDAKFGIPYEKAYDAYKLALEYGIKRFGIHMMTGSNNLEPYYFAEAVDKLMTIAGDIFDRLAIKPEYFDIGGGFGIPYDDDDSELNIDLTAKLVTDMFWDKCHKYNFGEPALYLEPGRYLVADAGYLISKVTGMKFSYKKFVGIDSGMNTLLRPALYGAKHRTYVYGKFEPNYFINLCGQICENSDIFAQMIPFPNVEEGDLVIMRDAGAYGYSMSSNYNGRLRPAEVMVEGDSYKLIRRRETIEDITGYY